jgi:hypothetical protein
LELVRVLEVPVDGRESHVSDTIEWFETIHDFFADQHTRDLESGTRRELIFNAIHEFFDIGRRHGTLRARYFDASFQLRTVEVLDISAPFQDLEVLGLDILIGREPCSAGGALPPTPHSAPGSARSGIHDPVLC